MMQPMTTPAHDLVTAAEAANRLGISRPTLSRWARSGRIAEHIKSPGLRGPRWFERSEVERLVSERGQA